MKNKLIIGLSIIGLSIFALSGVALADGGMKHAMAEESGFAALDADKSGALSEAEVANNATIAKNFAGLDKDKDGTLSAAEYEALNSLTEM